MRINEMDVEDLPEMPDLESYRKEDQYWKKLEAEDFFPNEPEQPYKVDESDTNDSELPYTLVRYVFSLAVQYLLTIVAH
jgi:hypothetical protein